MAIISIFFFVAGFSAVAAIHTGDPRAWLIAIVSTGGLMWAARRGAIAQGRSLRAAKRHARVVLGMMEAMDAEGRNSDGNS